MDPYDKQTMAQRYAMTMKAVRLLKDAGYGVITEWDHEFLRELKNNPEINALVTTLQLEERLDPRDPFFGGRQDKLLLYVPFNS